MFKKALYLLVAIAVITAIYLPISFAMDSWGNSPKQIYTYRTSGTNTMDVLLEPGKPFKLNQVMLHLEEAGTTSENITMSLESVYGDTWNVNMYTNDMDTIKDLILDYSTSEKYFESGDGLQLNWANGGTITYGLIIKYEMLPW